VQAAEARLVGTLFLASARVVSAWQQQAVALVSWRLPETALAY
jgi:hypothetical protein